MSFQSGKITLAVFNVPGLPELDSPTILERAKASELVKLDDVKSGEVYQGWTDGNALLGREFNSESCVIGDYLTLNYAKAERKASQGLIKAFCEREEQAYRKSNETNHVPSKVRKEIKESVIERLNSKALPLIKGWPVAIDFEHQRIYFGNAGQGIMDEFATFFYKTFGIELHQCTATEIALEIDPLTKLREWSMGREFLTWLFWQIDVNKNEIAGTMAVNAPLDWITSEKENGATNVIAKGELAPISNETRAALSEEKFLRKARLTITRERDIWAGTFDADKFTFGSLELPSGEEIEPAARFAERMQLLNDFYNLLKDRFAAFLIEYAKDDYAARRELWIQER